MGVCRAMKAHTLNSSLEIIGKKNLEYIHIMHNTNKESTGIFHSNFKVHSAGTQLDIRYPDIAITSPNVTDDQHTIANLISSIKPIGPAKIMISWSKKSTIIPNSPSPVENTNSRKYFNRAAQRRRERGSKHRPDNHSSRGNWGR